MNLLVHIVVILLIAGLALWAIMSLPFIDATIKQIIKIVIIVVVALWILGLAFGYFPARMHL
jgi:hypothetical protein